MIEKNIQLTFNSTVNKRVKVRSNCELYSHDKNNNEFELTINNYTLTNEEITVLFKFVKSVKYWETQGRIEDNKIKFKFDTSLITENERVNCYIILKNEEKESDVYSFSFDVKMSEYDLKDSLPVKERYFANSVVVDKLDVLTKEVLATELEKAKSTYALKTDLSEFVRTSDISDVVRTATLNDYQLKSEMPNVTEIVNNTIDSKGFLTTHQSLVDYAKKSELPIDYVSNSKLEEFKTQLTIDTSNFATKQELQEVSNRQVTVDTSNLATKEELNQLRGSQPNVDNLVTKEELNNKGYLTTHQDISNLATKQAVEDVATKVTQLESRPVVSSYDDTEIKRKLKELEDRPTTANIDTSNFVTTTQLEDKHYLTEHQSLNGYVTETQLNEKGYLTQHQDISKLATKEQLDELRNSQPTVDNLVTKEQLRKAFLNEEDQEKYVDLDTFVSATRGVLGNSTNEKGVEEYFNEMSDGLSEETKEIYLGNIYKNATETKVYRKNGFTNFKDMMYALAKVFPDNYNYKDENQRVDILTNRNYQDYIKSSGNVDTNDFATKNELKVVTDKTNLLELRIKATVNKFHLPFTITDSKAPFQYFLDTRTGSVQKYFGRIYNNNDERIIISGANKYTNLDTALYTLASSIPDGYTPDFEFSESDNLKFITTQNIHNYLPTNTGNTGNTTELDNRLKVLEAKQWEIHGRGMPNGTVTAPVGTTYVDEAVTNGALKWIKKSGTGNTGWEVLIGDTGWKTLPAASKLGNSFVKVRRKNDTIFYQFGGLSWGWFGVVRRGGAGYQVQGSDRERNCYILGLNGVPQGFRSESSLIGGIYNDKGTPYGTWYLGGAGDSHMLRFQFTDPVPTDRDIGDIRVSSISYLTNDPWPQN